jgi:glycosyltransferase involved in cell wall biosynthesis
VYDTHHGCEGQAGSNTPGEFGKRPEYSEYSHSHLAMPHISVVSPVYQAEECLRELHRRLVSALSAITDDFEIVLVDDGSRDRSWQLVEELAHADQRVKGIKLSKNFGQHFAITAGLDFAQGDWVVVMDCDLQDRPEEIPRLYQKVQEGCDIAWARRIRRRDSGSKKLSSQLFRSIFNALGDVRLDKSASNFSISSRQVIDSVRRFRERNRSFPLFLSSVGFKEDYVDVEHAARPTGRSTYTWSRLLKLAIDWVVSYSNRPLYIAIWTGLLLSLVAFTMAVVFVVRYLVNSASVAGWTSLMVALLFFSGLLLANMGLMGLYIGKVFDEVKARPLYFVQRTVNAEGFAPVTRQEPRQ